MRGSVSMTFCCCMYGCMHNTRATNTHTAAVGRFGQGCLLPASFQAAAHNLMTAANYTDAVQVNILAGMVVDLQRVVVELKEGCGCKVLYKCHGEGHACVYAHTGGDSCSRAHLIGAFYAAEVCDYLMRAHFVVHFPLCWHPFLFEHPLTSVSQHYRLAWVPSLPNGSKKQHPWPKLRAWWIN